MSPLPQRLSVTAALLLLAGCGTDVQSVMAPRGTQAGQIATLAWIIFAFGALVLALVAAAAWVAIRGPARLRGALARERTVIALGLVFPAVSLTLLLASNVFLMRTHLVAADAANAIRIEVVGEQWWWRVAYGDAAIASANEIRMPVGRPVHFTLKASDVIHSFWVPSLGGKVDMIPGRVTGLRLTAERPGVYRGQCAEYCGGPHALMALEVVAMPPAEYDAWLAREAAPARAPSGEQEQRGQSLFIASGCGACHAVRGTPATGIIGPDLTHFGSRRSVGIDTLPLTAENIARFIADGQRVKPGNRMPEFRIFSADEHAALAAYLLSLR
jgi:cytochrome c oxidase subunit II